MDRPDKPPMAVDFDDAGMAIAEALDALGFEVGSCMARWLLPGQPADRRFIAVPVGDIAAGKVLVAALAERLREKGQRKLADNLGPFAAVVMESRVLVVFLNYPGEAAGEVLH